MREGLESKFDVRMEIGTTTSEEDDVETYKRAQKCVGSSLKFIKRINDTISGNGLWLRVLRTFSARSA